MRYSCPGFHPSVCPFIRLSSQFTSTLALKSIQMTLFSKTTVSMNIKFHMQHDQTAGLQTGKLQPSRESKMAADTKNSKTNKTNFFSRRAEYVWLKFTWRMCGTLVFSDIKMKNICSGINLRGSVRLHATKCNLDFDKI